MKTSFDNFIIFEENLLFWQNMELNMHCAYDKKKIKNKNALCNFWNFRGHFEIWESFVVKKCNLG